MALNRLMGVRGTGGDKSAGGKPQRGDSLSIEIDQRENEASEHSRSVSRISSACNSSKEAA